MLFILRIENEKRKSHLKKLHQYRDDVIGGYVYGDIGQLFFLVIFLMVWVAGSITFMYSTFLTQYISNFIWIPIALVLFSVSGLLVIAGLNKLFRKKREKDHIFKTGIFSLMRHPIYLATILFYLGFILLSPSLLSILVWILIIIFYYMISRYEGNLLIKKI